MINPALRSANLSIDEYRQVVRQSLAPHRLELLAKRADWIRRTEKWIGSHFTQGSEVNVDRIRPRLELVTENRQHEIWRYCRLTGSIPFNRGCGRLLRYLIRDEGQPGEPIMGIMALSSPILICKPRDEWIGWQYPRDTDLKRRKLLTCMDMTVSMAVSPYNLLTAGKLVCLAALSNEVREDYRKKYEKVETPSSIKEGRLVLITTTSLYGSSVQYNRLRVDNRTRYKLIGYTSGYGNAHVTEAEFAAMERFLHEVGKPIAKGWGTGRSYRLRVYSAYHRHRFNEKHAPAHQHARSVYVAPLAANTEAFLRDETSEPLFHDLPFESLADGWRSRWLTSRLSKPTVMQTFRMSDPADTFLSRELTDIQESIAPILHTTG